MDKVVDSIGQKHSNTWQYDIVRGIMCLFIFNCHFLAMFSFPKQPYVIQCLKSFVSNAPLGVIYFFMLSGTVLSMSFMRKKANQVMIPRFIIKRTLRLLPPIMISIVGAYGLMKLNLIFIDDLGKNIELSDWAAKLYRFSPQDLSPLKDIFSTYFLGHSGYNANLWIVRVEFLVPIFMLMLYKYSQQLCFRIVVCLGLVGFMGGYVLMNVDRLLVAAYIFMFFMGIVIVWQITKKTPSPQTVKILSLMILLLSLLSVVFCVPINRCIDVLLCTLLLYAMYHKEYRCLRKLRTSVLINKLGKISYEFFVYHLFIVASFSCWFFTLLFKYCGYYTSLFITYIVTTIVVYLISWLSNSITSKYYSPLLKKLG